LSDIKYKPKNIGLQLAYQHRSAVSQGEVGKVYEKIDLAKVHNNSLPSDVRISRGVKALRMGIDRVSRLGARLRENKNVSVADNKLMKDEFIYLKRQLKTIFEREMGPSYAFNAETDFILNEAPAQFGRIIDSVYSGDINLSDRFNRIGDLLDLEADPYVLNFDGKFLLKDAPKSADIVTGVESLSSTFLHVEGRSPIKLEGELNGENYIDSAVHKVTSDILHYSASSKLVHMDQRNITDMSLLFDDAKGNLVEPPTT
jgi:hypothetical protein